MISVPNENGTIGIPTNEWTEGKKHHSYPCSSDSLSLIVSIEKGYSSFTLTCPQLLPSISFDSKLVVLPEVLKHAISYDQTFAPLALAIRQQIVPDLRSNEFTLLCYFYLNPVPSAVSLITRWFVDAETDAERASLLAQLVYMARTDRDGEDAGFVKDFGLSVTMSRNTLQNSSSQLSPDNLTDVFKAIKESDTPILSYDCLGTLQQNNQDPETIITLNQISETGFVIEDHSLLILGLSVSITELARLTEHKWPLFCERLLAEIPLYLRDYYSLGRLIAEKPEIILRLQSDYNLTLDVISFSSDGAKQSSNILRPRLLMASKDKPEIPAFLRIQK